MKKLEEKMFVDDIKMKETLSNSPLMKRLGRGSEECEKRKGRFVE